MKKLISLFALLCLLSTTSVAQASSPDEKAVANAVESMRVAMISGDKAALEKVGLSDLSYGHSSGRIENNEQFVDAIVTGKSDFVTLDLLDQTINIRGDVAIVRHILDADTNDSGKPGHVKIGVMLVFVKQANDWKLLARQAYKLPQ